MFFMPVISWYADGSTEWKVEKQNEEHYTYLLGEMEKQGYKLPREEARDLNIVCGWLLATVQGDPEGRARFMEYWKVMHSWFVEKWGWKPED